MTDGRLRFWVAPYDQAGMTYRIDWVVLREVDGRISGSSAYVRAERDDSGTGRVYHIAFTAVYRGQEVCKHEVVVGVPLDRKQPAQDSGGTFDSTEFTQLPQRYGRSFLTAEEPVP